MKKINPRFFTQILIVFGSLNAPCLQALDLRLEAPETDLEANIPEVESGAVQAPDIPFTLSTRGDGPVTRNSFVPPAPLADRLARQLGITAEQGAAGAGSIFRYARQIMGDESFRKIRELVPGMDYILNAGPFAESAAPTAAHAPVEFSDLAFVDERLKSEFDQLGLAQEMPEKFIRVIVDYLRSQGGESAASRLQKALMGG